MGWSGRAPAPPATNLARGSEQRYRGTAFLKERINLKALKLLGSCSRLACRCDALVFLFYRSPVTPLPERRRNTLLSVQRIRVRLANWKLLPQNLGEMFLPVSLEIDLLLRIADKTNQRGTRYPPERSTPYPRRALSKLMLYTRGLYEPLELPEHWLIAASSTPGSACRSSSISERF